MNKKTLSIIAILVVIVIVIVVFFGGKKDTAVNDINNQLSGVKKVSLENGNYNVSTDRTTVFWEGKKTLIEGYKDEGTINVKQGNIIVEAGEITGGKIVIDMDSIVAVKTGIGSNMENLTRHLKSKDFFDVAKYPVSTFELKLDSVEDGHYLAGNLEIKDKKEEISFPVSLSMENGELKIKGVAILNRTKWGIIYGSGSFFDNLKNNVIDDNFTVAFDLVASK